MKLQGLCEECYSWINTKLKSGKAFFLIHHSHGVQGKQCPDSRSCNHYKCSGSSKEVVTTREVTC